jgi:hypothetical protein
VARAVLRGLAVDVAVARGRAVGVADPLQAPWSLQRAGTFGGSHPASAVCACRHR